MNDRPDARRSRDTLTAVALMALGGLVAWSSRALPPPMLEPVGPAAFPLWTGLAMIALALALLIAAWRRAPAAMVTAAADTPVARPRNDLALITSLLTLAYVGVMELEWVGFRGATVVYVFGIMQLLGLPGGRWRRITLALGVALLFGVVLHYVFTRFFYIDLPS